MYCRLYFKNITLMITKTPRAYYIIYQILNYYQYALYPISRNRRHLSTNLDYSLPRFETIKILNSMQGFKRERKFFRLAYPYLSAQYGLQLYRIRQGNGDLFLSRFEDIFKDTQITDIEKAGFFTRRLPDEVYIKLKSICSPTDFINPSILIEKFRLLHPTQLYKKMIQP
ncbi:uncharacterized protein LOC135926137 isoform X2 [Gordionus sp. m RMFG-2023]|uniref:uncharacterized protein LOC135926137 isoform X2 n=1 Tax=Gordionus sp. m RMFG-2023 TaxID=3053472 RepID=UPI0031FE3E63